VNSSPNGTENKYGDIKIMDSIYAIHYF